MKNWIPFAFAAGGALAAAALLVNIFERKQEAKNAFFRVVELDDTIDDPAVWGKNFPIQYDLYKRTVDTERTRYGGSEAIPVAPGGKDPRDTVSQSKIEEDPRLKRMWLGYPFSVDFREERGHAYMLVDQKNTRRVTEFKQPGACLNCHASSYVAMKTAGGGDIMKGFAAMNAMPYAQAVAQVKHPVACIDCHDPKTMQLRITRPAFIEGMKAYKGEAYDVNTMATAQEMRSYVCGQCHVEYYFKGAEKRLTFPWHKGLQVDKIYDYYTEVKHTDFQHKESGAPVLKAQHPEFEMWSQGVHSRSGVSCADCHMPYQRVGATKVSDHHVRSPLLNINRACQGCHHFSESEMKERVELIQSRFTESRNVAMDALMELITDIQKAKEKGATDAQLAPAREAQRRAQFYLDFVEAENSSGFHAPQETLRVLTHSVDWSRKGQLAARQ
jgi:nitrite reductase (cytochrome c-552)